MHDSSESPLTSHHATTAEEFLGALSPQWPVWQPDPPRWIFRGHSTTDYLLKAKTHRNARNFCEDYGIVAPNGSTDAPRWSVDEVRFKALLSSFGRALDAAALPIPSVPPDLVPLPRRMRMSDPEHHQWALVGLAQHLGLPTPWLDWAQTGRVAAYFAAVGAARRKPQSASIEVWALRRDFVEATQECAADGADMRVMILPRSGNVRLHAQGGVFTWLRGENAHDVTVDEHVRKLAEQHGSTLGFNGAVMRRFTLLGSEAPKLLRLLSYEGITGASVFPGYEGVVQAMSERALWDRTS